jgi:hypothetical protein
MLTTAVAAAVAPPASAASLEEGLLAQAASVLKACRDKGYKNVGVLKFHVSKDGKTLSHNVGTLNLSLARRMEIALVLQNDPRNPIGVIRDASSVAAKLDGVNHRTAAGRAPLFGTTYPLMWGTDSVTPDAFVSGFAVVDDDRRTMEVDLNLFDRTAKPVTIGEAFSAAVPAGSLIEFGESFSLRGAFDGGQVAPAAPVGPAAEQKAATVAVATANAAVSHPLQAQSGCPVALEFRYDGRPAPMEFKGGRAFVPSPAPGQKVELVLTRDGGPESYGVVLKVNGENTLGRQTKPDFECRKWVMPKGCSPYVIRGYQTGGKVAQEFSVLNGRESAKQAVNYGADVGTVTYTVFRAAAGAPPAPPAGEFGKKVVAVHTLDVPKKPSLKLLRESYLEDFGTKGAFGDDGGLVVPGREIENGTTPTRFVPDPTPLAAVTVVYFNP